MNWSEAEDKSCKACQYHSIDPAFTVLALSICSSLKVIGEKGSPRACQVARSPQGRCGPTARFLEK